ncbi:uncharacterized protein LOC117647991 isoform X2 [Thrips palmi]|uniref:Uncharacterized protein LOC117647991 isoform X2 n=1 Tax=Thrips palmi TaxID=161013 RepID=A0A6P8Z7A3_THRPL|nr:uncharacterized protein LOC117647991 isoform X2 [Thrips palmi]
MTTAANGAGPAGHAPAPDGGYGWVVVVAYSLNTIVVLQLIGVFGLIFKDLFATLAMPATDIALILNLNMSFSLLLGIFTNALMRKFGYRQTGAAGAVLAAFGMVLTALSSSSPAFLFNFGIVMASGLGLSAPAFTVALNSYFRARRGAATGLAMGITGVSAILLPQLVGVLLREYGARGTCVLFAGLALNGVVAAALLQPVAWHRPAVKAAVPVVLETPSVHENEDDPMVDKEFVLTALPVLKPLEEGDAEVGGLGMRQRTPSTTSTYYTARCPSSNSIWASSNVLDMGSSVITLDDTILEEVAATPLHAEMALKAVKSEAGEDGRRGAARRCCAFIVDLFDLSLLSSPSTLNLMLGVSVASFAEMNFTVFVPFILADRGLDTASIANAMSVIAMANTVFRLLAPLAQALLGWSSKNIAGGGGLGLGCDGGGPGAGGQQGPAHSVLPHDHPRQCAAGSPGRRRRTAGGSQRHHLPRQRPRLRLHQRHEQKLRCGHPGPQRDHTAQHCDVGSGVFGASCSPHSEKAVLLKRIKTSLRTHF